MPDMNGIHRRRQLLLACGVAASAWYVAINLFVPTQWPQYSVTAQTVSELSAIGAPTRQLWVVLVLPYVLLYALFGCGVLASAGGSRALRAAGWLILFYCLFNAWWPPMHAREVLAAGGGGPTDTLHLVWAGVSTLLFLLTMACMAVASATGFRLFTALAALLMLVFGALTAMDSPAVSHNLPTPWIGVWERVNIGIFLLWVAAAALLLIWRAPRPNRGEP